MDKPGPYVFRVSGQLSHCIGSLLPPNEDNPAFAQIYLLGDNGHNELNMRMAHHDETLDRSVIEAWSTWMNGNNAYSKFFKSSSQILQETPNSTIVLKSVPPKNNEKKRYNLPSTSDVAAIIDGTGELGNTPREIILKRHNNKYQRIDELHTGYFSLRYPVLFPYGEQHWCTDYIVPEHTKNNGGKLCLTHIMLHSSSLTNV